MYKDGVTEINRELLTQWFDQEVPAPVLDCVVTVPVGQDGPGKMRQEGPAGATEQRTTSDEDPIIFALESEVSDFNDSRNDACSPVVMLLQKLEELEAAGARSVALEMELPESNRHCNPISRNQSAETSEVNTKPSISKDYFFYFVFFSGYFVFFVFHL